MLVTEQRHALRQISIFRNAAELTLDRAAGLSRWQRHADGTIILSYQDASTDIFFILEGAVRAIIYAPDGKALLFTDLEKGEVFGEIAAVDRGPRSASIEALRPTLVAVMSAADFERILREDAEVSIATLRLLTSRVRRLSERVYEFRAFAVQNRIHAELLRLAKASGVTTRRCHTVSRADPGRNCGSRKHTPRGRFPRAEPPRFGRAHKPRGRCATHYRRRQAG